MTKAAKFREPESFLDVLILQCTDATQRAVPQSLPGLGGVFRRFGALRVKRGFDFLALGD